MYSLIILMYNSLSIAIFHFSWKMQSDVWGTVMPEFHITGGNLLKVQIRLMVGWDFGSTVTSYSIISALSAYGLIFLGATLSGHSVLCSYLVVVVTGKNLLNQSFGLIKTKVVQLFNLVR
jgi:hypothetical protein